MWTGAVAGREGVGAGGVGRAGFSTGTVTVTAEKEKEKGSEKGKEGSGRGCDEEVTLVGVMPGLLGERPELRLRA